MKENVTAIKKEKTHMLEMDLSDDVVITMAATHLRSVVHTMLEAGNDRVELNNNDVAALLWPVLEILEAADKRFK